MPDLSDLRLVFAGTPDFAASHLEALIATQAPVVGVYTQPDRRAGRGKKLSPSAVKQVAVNANIPLFQPRSLRDEEAQRELAALAPDVIVVVAYGLILPQLVLDIPKYACINVHGSLLPRWRGAAPIQRTIEAGDSESGITIMRMEAGLDTGPMLAIDSLPVPADMSAGELHDALAIIGPTLLLKVLSDLPGFLQRETAQNDAAACYAHKLEKPEAEIDWTLSAEDIQRQTLAFNPFPGCWSMLDGDRIKIWRAQKHGGKGMPGEIIAASEHGLEIACGKDSVLISELQLPGGRAMPAAELLRSKAEIFAINRILGS